MKNIKTILAVALCVAGVGIASAATNAVPWRVPAYTLTARAMPVRDALDTFGVAQGIPVVASESVKGVVSGNFKDVPAAEFLDRLATINNLTWYFDGATLYVYGSSEVQTMLMDLKYMKANEVGALLRELGVEDARFPIKTAADGEMIMVSGPPRYVMLISEMIARADKLREQRTFNEVETRVFPLKYTWADTVTISVSSPESSVSIRGVAQMLEEVMKSDGAVRTRDVSDTNGVAQADAPTAGGEFKPVIRAENRLNAVIVRDVATHMPMYERLIEQLDVPQKLIEMGVTVVELTKEDALDWQLSLKVEGAYKHVDAAAGQNAQNLFTPMDLAGQGLAGAATYLGHDVNVAAALSALKSKGKARNISRTTLLTMNNFATEMTDTQSYHARVVGEDVANLQEVNAGTRLQLKPRLVPSPATNLPRQVWLTMQLQDGGFQTVTVDQMPMTRTSTVKSQMAVFEGEAIMVAGYMRDVEEKAGWGIPYLRDIPWIGWIFGGATINHETVQRMFIISPRVVDLDTEALVRLQATRLRDVREEEELEENMEESDDARELRKQEREARRERRREKVEDHVARREAELDHEKAQRKIVRDQQKKALEADKKRWKEEVQAEIDRIKADEKATEEAKEKAEEAKKAEENSSEKSGWFW